MKRSRLRNSAKLRAKVGGLHGEEEEDNYEGKQEYEGEEKQQPRDL